MYQRWVWLTFLHWRYEPQIIRRFVPPQLTLDTFDGAAWLALTPFKLVDLHPPGLPVLPWISWFPETNVRTYVRGPDGERGVWFFTLEAGRLAAVIGARAAYHLPYRWSAMQVDRTGALVRYQSRRKRWFGYGGTDIVIEPGARVELGQLENFLTARYRLYAIAAKRLYTAPIEHDPWPLQQATIIRLQQNLIQQSGLPAPRGEPLVHYSDDLVVKIGKIQRIA